MNLRWIVISILVVFCTISNAFSQAVTTDPEFPTVQDAVTVYFDATKGDQGLKDYSGDIYAHTGVITSESSGPTNWKHVIAAWDENTDKAKLTKISANLYTLEITPSIKEFYGVAEDEVVQEMAFVFRNADGSKTAREADGSDIFANVYEAGLNVNISSPKDDYIIVPGDTINIIASSNESDSMLLFIDESLIINSQGNSINYDYKENISGLHEIVVKAKNSEDQVTDTVYYYARGDANIKEVPQGWIKGINYLSEDSVGLLLFAPYKDYVFVIGDFTDWRLNENFMMNKTPDGEYYWIGIGGLIPQKEYIFQYYIDGELRIADPYTDKTSDPNDKYISESTYPNLIQYPEGKTTNIASVLQTNQEDYVWKHNYYEKPDKQNLIIYELLIRDFLANHDYKTLKDTLDYLDSLGINAIELMPINEFEGNESWGYNPSFYFAPDKYYGPKNDLKAFIDSCHGRNISVIMDMVLNHSYGQSPLVRMYFDGEKPTSENPWYNVQSPNSTYSWGYDFNHESVYTQEFVDSVNSYWLKEYKMDGFRFDFTKGFTNNPGDGWSYDGDRINILKRMALRLWEVNPDAYVILEHLTENSEEKNLAEFGMLLWGNMNYEYNEATMGYSSDIDGVSYKDRNWSVPNLVSYMESHDEERLMYKNLQYGNSVDGYNIQELNTALHRIELAANFFIPVPGPKMIWQFGELGYDYSIDYNGRLGNKPIRWDYFASNRKRLYHVFEALNNLKTTYDVFSTDQFEISQTSNLKTLYLHNDEMNVVILGNFDVEQKTIIPNFPNTGNWYEFYSGDTLAISSASDSITLDAGEYRLYTDQKLYDPDIPLSSKYEVEISNQNLKVYPNPSSGKFYFDTNEYVGKGEIYLYNLNGELKISKQSNESILELDVSHLDAGLYFYRLVKDGRVYTGKVLKR